MRTKPLLGAAIAGALVLGSGVAAADDVELFHDKGFWSDALQQVGDQAAEDIGIRIISTAYSAPEQYKAFLQSSVASGDMPDMFTWWTGGVYRDLIDSGEVAELDEIWDELVASGDFSQSTRDFYTVDGHAYGVPLHLSRWIALYNVEHFKEVGVGEPQTWEELLDVAEKLQAAGHTPFVATTQDGWRGFIWFQELMIRTDPVAYMGLHDGSTPYDGDAVRNAFQIWSDWYAKGWFTDPRSNEEAPDFVRGDGSIYLIGDWSVGIIEGLGMVPGEDFSAFIMPNMDPNLPHAAILEGGPIMMSRSGIENPDAVAALKYFVSVAGANAWADASGNALGNQNAEPPNVVVAKINDDVATHGTIAIERWWEAVPADLQGELVAEFNRFMLDPTMETAEDVMANIQALNAEYWEDQE